MSAGDRVVSVLVLLILLAGFLLWRGHPYWALAAAAPAVLVIAGAIRSCSQDPVALRIRRTRESIARVAEIGLKSSPSEAEKAEAHALAEMLCGELAHDLRKETSPELVAALKNRGPVRSAVLRVLSHMSGHLGTPDSISAVRVGSEDFKAADFISLIRLHRHFDQPGELLALARRVVAETPPARRAEILPSLILIAPDPQEDWVTLLRPYRAEFLAASPLGIEDDSYGAVGHWQATWKEALA